MTTYSINFNGVLDGSLGTVLPGTCVCRDATGRYFVVSTPSTRNGQRTSGVVTFTSYGGKSVQIHSDGMLDREKSLIPFLDGVNDAPIRVNNSGGLERAIPVVDGDEIVGSCNQWGDAILTFGQSPSTAIDGLSGVGGQLRWSGTSVIIDPDPAANLNVLIGSIDNSFAAIWAGLAAATPTTVNASLLFSDDELVVQGPSDVTLRSSSGTISVDAPALSITRNQSNAVIAQDSVLSGSPTPLTIRAQGSLASNSGGADLILRGGIGTGTAKVSGVRMELGSGSILAQAVDTSTSGANRVLALCGGGAIDSSNISSGDMVMYVANAATAPVTPATFGATFFCQNGQLKYMDALGFVVTL